MTFINAMKTKYFFLLVLTMTLGLTGCKEKKVSKDIITTLPKKTKEKPTQSMSSYHDERQTDWCESRYTVSVIREADHSLPLVHGDDSTKYFDNHVVVKVFREDKTVFFEQTFTKSFFKKYISDENIAASALLGVVFVKAEGDYLAVSVGSPDVTSDEYIPLVLKLSRFGNLTVTKDDHLDTSSQEEED